MNRFFISLKKLAKLFSRYPMGASLHRKYSECLGWSGNPSADSPELAMQLVPDKLYFMLFGAIRSRLQMLSPCRGNLVIVRAVSGAVGTGWKAELKRTALAAWLFSLPWVRAFGTMADAVAYRSASYCDPRNDLRDWKESKTLWNQLKGQGEELSLRLGDIEIADLLVDSYLRFKPSPVFDVSDPFVRRLIWQALRDVRRADLYFGRVKPCLYISSYSTYLEHGIAVRIALKHQVPVWTFGNLSQFGKRLSQADSFHTADFSKYRTEFEALDDKEERLLSAKTKLELRLSGEIDAATSYMRQSTYSSTLKLLPKGLNGAVIIFLHDFYDSPHVYPGLVFQDFWRWICYTIDVLQQDGIRFFLKPHPNQIALGDQVLFSLRQKYPTLKWIPSDVNNVQLVQAGVACGVTVYGTVAHELAYLGVPSIACARHPHHAFDFCRTAQSRDEYASMLRSYKLQPISKVEMQKQALSFYYMHNLYGTTEQLALRLAFVKFWKLCNSDPACDSAVSDAFQAMVRLPAFDKFVQSMSDSIMVSS